MVKVLVTGGNGFIAAHILEALLARGDDVVFTVRYQDAGTKVLNKHAGKSLQFSVVEGITIAGAMDQVFAQHSDLDCVLHTASPFIQKFNDAVGDVLSPAVRGTEELLRSVTAHAPSVKRVVLLSSFLTMMANTGGGGVEVYDESMWNPVTWDAAKENPRLTYIGSKTLAEKAAWDYVEREQPGFDLVSLNPALVFGPVIQHLSGPDKMNMSNQRISAMVQGAFKDSALPPTGIYLWVDVRDVALAHIRAIETPEAGGQRFLLVGGHFSNKAIADAIVSTHPQHAPKLPAHMIDDTPANVYGYNGTKAETILGLRPRPFHDSIRDTVSSLQAVGVGA